MTKILLNKKIMTLLLSLSLVVFLLQPALAQKKDEEEEKQFTPAQFISPKKLDDAQNRAYDEGIIIKKIEIEGNNLVKSEDIIKNLSIQEGTKFDRNEIKNDLRIIYDMGYFTEKIKAVPKATSSGVVLKIRVEENIPVTGFNITGNKVVSTDEISKILNIQIGLPQNIMELNRAVKQVEDLYAEKGYVLARVKELTDDPDGIINLKLNEGIIDDIKITGNTRTKEFVIRRNILTSPGMVYNENTLKQDLTRIYGTQAFADVRRVLSASEKNPDKYLLTVEVDEKRTGAVSLGGGVDTGSGLFGSLGYSDNNFRGVGQQLSLNFMTGSGMVQYDRDFIRRANFQLETRFVEPRFRQTLNSLEIKSFAKEFGSYQVPLGIERRFGGEIEVARPFKKVPNLAGSVSLGVETIDVREGDYDRILGIFNERGVDISRRAEQLVGGTFISLGPSLMYDTRNNMLNPTDGIYSSIGYKESYAISGDSDSFGKFTAGAKKYFPIGKKSTIVVGGRFGSVSHGDLPEFAAFRLGGTNTMRGFSEGDVGNGEGFLMASAELRTPVPFMEKITSMKFFNNIRTAFFLDAGTIFQDTLTNQLYNRPGHGIAAGTGLRFLIPGVGPIRVDYGYPLTSIGGDKKGRFTFGFGDTF
jgi:outer membrane protein insertion porin family